MFNTPDETWLFIMDSRLKWKATALLTWVLATDIAYCLPHVGNELETTLQTTATGSAGAHETQYPPSNSEDRLLVPESHPVRLREICYMVYGMVLTFWTRCIE